MIRDLSDEGSGKNRKERAWLIFGLFLCSILCVISLGQMNIKRGAGLFPISISSNRVANYGSDGNTGYLAPISLDIIGDVIRDQNPQVTDVAALISTIHANMRTPVSTVTPWLSGEATQDVEISVSETQTASRTSVMTHTGSPTVLVTRMMIQTTTLTGTSLQTPSRTPTHTSPPSKTLFATSATYTPTLTGTSLQTPSRTPTHTSTPSKTLFATSATYTPTFPPANLVIQIINPTSGKVIDKRSDTRFEAEAWDPIVGNTNGSGISSVSFTLYNSTNELLFSLSDNNILFCAFGDDGVGNCEQMSIDSLWDALINGNYSLTATAYASDGRSKSTTIPFSIAK